MKTQRGSRRIAVLCLTSALDGVGGQRHAPAAIPPGITRYRLYKRLCRPQGRSGQVRKVSPLSGLEPSTVQPVANRYTDYANSLPILIWFKWYNIKGQVKIYSTFSGFTLPTEY
jgi:hypothetical protein